MSLSNLCNNKVSTIKFPEKKKISLKNNFNKEIIEWYL